MNQMPTEWKEVCQYIQQALQEEFPNAVNFENQCKRAGVMLDIFFKKKKVKRQLVAGWITKEGDSDKRQRGHVWLLVSHEKKTHVLDVTLMQFQDYIGKDCPSIVFGPKKEMYEEWHYEQDLYGTYKYEKRDFEWSVRKIEEYTDKMEEKVC